MASASEITVGRKLSLRRPGFAESKNCGYNATVFSAKNRLTTGNFLFFL